MSYNCETKKYEGFIYKITNTVNGKFYIGQTRQSINRRMSFHKYDMNRKNTPLYKDMRKFGFDVFRVEILEDVEGLSPIDLKCKLNRLEKFYIMGAMSEDRDMVYNIDFGGDTGNATRKRVCQYDMSGNLVKVHESLQSAANECGLKYSTSISSCLSGDSKNSAGYVWRYENDPFDKYPSRRIPNSFHIDVYDIGGNLIDKLNSERAVIKKYNCCHTSLEMILKGLRGNYRNQYVFRYENEGFDKYPVSSKNEDARVKVLKYSKNMDYISSYESIDEAAKTNRCDPSGITKVCRGKRKTCGGFIWKYEDNN